MQMHQFKPLICIIILILFSIYYFCFFGIFSTNAAFVIKNFANSIFSRIFFFLFSILWLTIFGVSNFGQNNKKSKKPIRFTKNTFSILFLLGFLFGTLFQFFSCVANSLHKNYITGSELKRKKNFGNVTKLKTHQHIGTFI